MNLKPLRSDQQQKPPTRWNYQKNSEDFIHWVNRLGIERTFIGRLVHRVDERFHLRRIALIFLFSLSVSFLISWDFELSYSGYKEGDLASADIKSPLSFEVIDSAETERRRLEAEESIPPVYDYDVGLYDQLVTRVRQALRGMRTTLAQTQGVNKGRAAVKEFLSRQSDFESELGGVRISKENFEWLVKERFKPNIEIAVTQTLEKLNGQKIYDDAFPMRQHGRKRVIINILERGYKGEEFLQDSSQLVDTSEVRRRIAGQTGYPGFPKSGDVVELNDFMRSLVLPNLTLNKQETESRRQRTRDAVSPFIAQIKKGQIIVRAGQPVQKFMSLF